MSEEKNFIFSNDKWGVDKFDITSKLSIETWNTIRRLAMLQMDVESNEIENNFR